jgi:hypothetical protein
MVGHLTEEAPSGAAGRVPPPIGALISCGHDAVQVRPDHPDTAESLNSSPS